jgi:hypothetical protein
VRDACTVRGIYTDLYHIGLLAKAKEDTNTTKSGFTVSRRVICSDVVKPRRSPRQRSALVTKGFADVVEGVGGTLLIAVVPVFHHQ